MMRIARKSAEKPVLRGRNDYPPPQLIELHRNERMTPMVRHISSEEMEDYADGRLTGERARQVELYLRDNPDENARIEALRRQSAWLRRLGHRIASEPMPPRLRDMLRRLRD